MSLEKDVGNSPEAFDSTSFSMSAKIFRYGMSRNSSEAFD
jgi:hypothetical protein